MEIEVTAGAADELAAGAASCRGRIYRPATRADLPLVHGKLVEAIQTSPHHCEAFKAFETRRLNIGFLDALHDADPFHIMLFEHEGEAIGFMMSGPELGTLWLYWVYMFPEYRRGGLALRCMREFIAHWDNGRFHKVATFTRPGNDAAIMVMKRYGFRQAATLEKHIFGEDYLLFERVLTKSAPGYDNGLRLGRLAGLKRRFRRIFRRSAA